MTSTLAYPAIHPFPARMAPELVNGALGGLRHDAVLLDPMMGSGSFPLAAGRSGHTAIGIDSDPLAVIIARAGLCRWDGDHVRHAAREVARAALSIADTWEHPDTETDDFIDYWFDPVAKRRLGALARGIRSQDVELRDPLWVAFSRLIITKDAGASKARDVSHSRPHRVRDAASFDPAEKFAKSVDLVVHRAMMYGPPAPGGSVVPLRADVRSLPLATNSIDTIMTSPPYLTAIDYLRGHRMSLVWMGHTVSELRTLRSDNIGSERGAELRDELEGVGTALAVEGFPGRAQRVIFRYLNDMYAMMIELCRVVRSGGNATFVVADATSAGRSLDIALATRLIGEVGGFRHVGDQTRELPGDRRYLPLPDASSSNSLARRMRVETIVNLSATS